jgi:hypothetical protein
MPRSSRPLPTTARRLALPAIAVLAVAAVPSGAAAASKNCPTTGKTIARNLSSDAKPVAIARVWSSGGRVYGCTTASGIAPKRRLLATGTVRQVRLDFDTVGWTAKVRRGGRTVTRVWVYDLADGRSFLRGVPAVPARAKGERRVDGTVDVLRVHSGLFAAWVTGGSTVVIAGKTPTETTLLTGGEGEDGPNSAPLYVDGGMAVAGSYQADDATRRSLTRSLRIAPVPGYDGDSDDCGYGFLTAFTWKLGGTQSLEARMEGNRVTEATCPA